MTTPPLGHASGRLGDALEAVVSVLVLPWALYAHRRTFKQMEREWKDGHRP